VQQQISERYRYVQQLISQHHEELERIAQALLERESLDEQQLQLLLRDAGKRAELAGEGEAGDASLAAAARHG
jgi:ATP-dependent Zn protease